MLIIITSYVSHPGSCHGSAVYQAQVVYNNEQTAARAIVEQTFGPFKNSWRILQCLSMFFLIDYIFVHKHHHLVEPHQMDQLHHVLYQISIAI